MASAAPTMELSLSALAFNHRVLSRLAGDAFLICTVKANAYGHGALPCVRLLAADGARHFAVSCAEEALTLAPVFSKHSQSCKELFAKPPVLYLFGPVCAKDLLPLSKLYTCLSVHSLHYARWLSHAIEALKKANLLSPAYRQAVFLKAETGMNRLGLSRPSSLLEICRLPHLLPLSVYSHLAEAETAPNARTREQLCRFLAMRRALLQGGNPLPAHLSAGAALCRFGALGAQGVRAGLPLYGVPPANAYALGLRPVMRLYADVLSVKTVRKGEGVGYGSYRAPVKMRVACLGIGYADGLPTTVRGTTILFRNRPLTFIGDVCMDRSFLSLGDAPVHEGDRLLLFGESGEQTAAFAASCGISPYVLLSLRSERTQKVYTSP